MRVIPMLSVGEIIVGHTAAIAIADFVSLMIYSDFPPLRGGREGKLSRGPMMRTPLFELEAQPREELSPLVSHLLFAACGAFLGFALGLTPVGRLALELVLWLG